MRFALVALTAVFLTGPSAAQPAGTASGRFEIAPSEGGFTRLDTRTGAVSHCGRRDDGTWFCEPLAGGDTGLEASIGELNARVQGLSERMTALSARLDELSVRLDAVATKAATPAAAADQPGGAPGFAEQVAARLFDMVRRLKHGGDAGTG